MHAAGSTVMEKVRPSKIFLHNTKSPISVELISSSSESESDDMSRIDECPSDPGLSNGDPDSSSDSTTESSDQEVNNEEFEV